MTKWKNTLRVEIKESAEPAEKAEAIRVQVQILINRLERRAERIRKTREMTEEEGFTLSTWSLEDAVDILKDAKEDNDIERVDDALRELYEYGDRDHRLWVELKRVG